MHALAHVICMKEEDAQCQDIQQTNYAVKCKALADLTNSLICSEHVMLNDALNFRCVNVN